MHTPGAFTPGYTSVLPYEQMYFLYLLPGKKMLDRQDVMVAEERIFPNE